MKKKLTTFTALLLATLTSTSVMASPLMLGTSEEATPIEMSEAVAPTSSEPTTFDVGMSDLSAEQSVHMAVYRVLDNYFSKERTESGDFSFYINGIRQLPYSKYGEESLKIIDGKPMTNNAFYRFNSVLSFEGYNEYDEYHSIEEAAKLHGYTYSYNEETKEVHITSPELQNFEVENAQIFNDILQVMYAIPDTQQDMNFHGQVAIKRHIEDLEEAIQMYMKDPESAREEFGEEAIADIERCMEFDTIRVNYDLSFDPSLGFIHCKLDGNYDCSFVPMFRFFEVIEDDPKFSEALNAFEDEIYDFDIELMADINNNKVYIKSELLTLSLAVAITLDGQYDTNEILQDTERWYEIDTTVLTPLDIQKILKPIAESIQKDNNSNNLGLRTALADTMWMESNSGLIDEDSLLAFSLVADALSDDRFTTTINEYDSDDITYSLDFVLPTDKLIETVQEHNPEFTLEETREQLERSSPFEDINIEYRTGIDMEDENTPDGTSASISAMFEDRWDNVTFDYHKIITPASDTVNKQGLTLIDFNYKTKSDEYLNLFDWNYSNYAGAELDADGRPAGMSDEEWNNIQVYIDQVKVNISVNSQSKEMDTTLPTDATDLDGLMKQYNL